MAPNLFMSTTNAGSGDPALLPAARESALQIVELLKAVPPFSYLDAAEAAKSVGRIFSEEYLTNANDYFTAAQSGALTNPDRSPICKRDEAAACAADFGASSNTNQ